MDIYSTYTHVYIHGNVRLHFCVIQVCVGVCKEMLMMFEIQKANIVKKRLYLKHAMVLLCTYVHLYLNIFLCITVWVLSAGNMTASILIKELARYKHKAIGLCRLLYRLYGKIYISNIFSLLHIAVNVLMHFSLTYFRKTNFKISDFACYLSKYGVDLSIALSFLLASLNITCEYLIVARNFKHI